MSRSSGESLVAEGEIPPLFKNRAQDIGALFEVERGFAEVGVVFDQEPFIVTGAFQFIADRFAVESGVSAAEFTEAEARAPAVKSD